METCKEGTLFEYEECRQLLNHRICSMTIRKFLLKRLDAHVVRSRRTQTCPKPKTSFWREILCMWSLWKILGWAFQLFLICILNTVSASTSPCYFSFLFTFLSAFQSLPHLYTLTRICILDITSLFHSSAVFLLVSVTFICFSYPIPFLFSGRRRGAYLYLFHFFKLTNFLFYQGRALQKQLL